jgi:hypothetical protein
MTLRPRSRHTGRSNARGARFTAGPLGPSLGVTEFPAVTGLRRPLDKPIRLPDFTGPPMNVISDTIGELDAELVVDDSGSTDFTDPGGKRYAACRSVVRLLGGHGHARVGVVHWGSDSPAFLAVSPLDVARRRNRVILDRALRIPPSLGGSVPASGLRRATEGLALPSGRRVAVILITDGGTSMDGMIAALAQLPAGSVHVLVVDQATTANAASEIDHDWADLPLGSYHRLDVFDTAGLAWQVAEALADALGFILPPLTVTH